MRIPLLVLTAIILAFFLGTFVVSTDKPEMTKITSVSAEEFSDEVGGKDAVILDVRTPEEFEEGRIAGAKNIDFYETDFRKRLNQLDKDAAYKVYCNSGNRSSKSLQMMKELGFTNVTELSGGIQAWVSGDFPVCKNC